MWIFGKAACTAVLEASRHAEVNQKRTTALEAENQILAAPLERAYSLAAKLVGDRVGRERLREPRVEDLDVLEAPTDEQRLEPVADGLDLGKLRHVSSVATRRTAATR